MSASLTGAALLNVAAAAMPNWGLLLLCRAVEGLVLGGVPAIAMAYLAEEVDRDDLGLSMGIYVAGTALGGMAGRVGAGVIAEWMSWPAALVCVGLMGLVASLVFLALLPPSKNFVRKPGFDPQFHMGAWLMHLRDSRLRLLFIAGFLVMGAFVAVYNYAGFRLMASPFNLDQSAIGLIFLVYVFGIATSSIAGGLADRIGRHRVLPFGFAIAIAGTAMTLSGSLPVIVAGLALLTIGLFASHSVASGWVGRLAAETKGQASSLYLLSYYGGSSVGGTIGGWFFSAGGWPALIGFAIVALLLGLAACLRLAAKSEV